MMKLLFEIITCAIENCGYILFFDTFLEGRRRGILRRLRYPILLVSMVILVESIGLLPYDYTPVIRYPFVVLLLIIFCRFYYDIDIGKSIFFSVMNYLLCILFELVFCYLFGTREIAGNNLLILLILVLYVDFTVVLRRIFSKTKTYLYRNKISWSKHIWFPLLSVFTSIYFWIYSVEHPAEQSLVYLFLTVAFLIFNVLSLLFMQNALMKEDNLRLLEMQNRKNLNQLQTFQDMQSLYERQGKKLHDYRKQLMTVQELISNGDTKSALAFTENLTKSIAVELSEVNTGHPVINAVLNQHYQIAKEKGIGVSFIVDDLQEVVLKDDEIVILLGNLLENAICECEKVIAAGKDAVINLKCVTKDERLVITVRNTVLQPVLIEDNKVIGKHTEGHGIGLSNVESVVEKYNGDFAISCDEKEFTAVVMV